MLFKRKKTAGIVPKEYDHEHKRPAIRCSICTGEEVAGFVDTSTGKFEEAMLIIDEEDLEVFKKTYSIEGDVEKIY